MTVTQSYISWYYCCFLLRRGHCRCVGNYKHAMATADVNTVFRNTPSSVEAVM